MNYHWYNEILRILCFLGIADLRCNIALSAATACPTRLELWAPRFQPLCDIDIDIHTNYNINQVL